MINRRQFLGNAGGWAAGMALATGAMGAVRSRPARFSRVYAPHIGMFRHHAGGDPIDQIRFMADEGFGALEDAGLRARPVPIQERMGAELAKRGIEMGLFVGLADFGRATFASSSSRT